MMEQRKPSFEAVKSKNLMPTTLLPTHRDDIFDFLLNFRLPQAEYQKKANTVPSPDGSAPYSNSPFNQKKIAENSNEKS
jgi:ribosomal protein L1